MKPLPEDNDVLVSTLLFLLTRYTMDQDPLVGKAIVQHLEMLQARSKTSQSSLINTCERLCKHWRGAFEIAERSNAAAQNPLIRVFISLEKIYV